MHRIRQYLFVTLALAASLSAAPAWAASFIQITYQGVFSSGTDTGGLFGAAGSSLVGQSYTATFAIDTTNVVTSSAYNTLYYNVAGLSPVVTTATITVGGVSTLIAGSTSGSMSKSDYSNAGRYLVTFTDLAGDGSLSARTNFQVFLPAGQASGIDTVIPTTAIPSANPSVFTLTMADGSLATGKIASFSVSSATGLPTSLVPEPATWMTMILGFGMIGGAMRRRRSVLRQA
jgi:hypothetical protein